MSNSVLLERIDDVQSFLQTPGHWHTTTSHQAYQVLQALSWHPQVRIGDELFVPEGSILFAEVLGVKPLTPNVQKIGWGTVEDFYQNRLRDYDNWETAFWRELVQNARDAKATRVDIECVPDTFVDPETGDRVDAIRCSFADNGSGMTYDTMMTAFFRRGGSQKSEGSAGGFGDAKNLILTPWLGYRVESRDAVVVGRHEELFADLLVESGAPMLNGTRITVWMPPTRTTTQEHAQYLIEQSSLDSIAFYVNGKRVRSSLAKGTIVKEVPIRVGSTAVGEMIVRHSPRAARHGVYVRSYGLYTFDFLGFSGSFKGVVTIDINAPPINVFTTKRDGLSYNSNAKAEVTAILQSLTQDPKTALKKQRDKKETVFKGSGSIGVREGAVAEIAAEALAKMDLASSMKKISDGTFEIKLKDTRVFEDAIHKAFDLVDDAESEDDDAVPSLAPIASTFMEAIASAQFIDSQQVAVAVKMALWKPDFLIYQNISPFKMPAAMHPSTMSKKNHELIRVWTEICRFLMVQYGMDRPFGVGFVLDTEYDSRSYDETVMAAMYRKNESGEWLLVNPIHVRRFGSGDDVRFEAGDQRYDLDNPRDLENLVAMAVHEITHMQGFSSHNEAYSSQLTHNIGAALRLGPVIKKIVKAAKASVREERSAARQAKKEARGAASVRAPKVEQETLDLPSAAAILDVFTNPKSRQDAPQFFSLIYGERWIREDSSIVWSDRNADARERRGLEASPNSDVDIIFPDGSAQGVIRPSKELAKPLTRALAIAWAGPAFLRNRNAMLSAYAAIKSVVLAAGVYSANLPHDFNDQFRTWNSIAGWDGIPANMRVTWDEYAVAYDRNQNLVAEVRDVDGQFLFVVRSLYGSWLEDEYLYDNEAEAKQDAEYTFAVRRWLRMV
jgi:hypothetical protein